MAAIAKTPVPLRRSPVGQSPCPKAAAASSQEGEVHESRWADFLTTCGAKHHWNSNWRVTLRLAVAFGLAALSLAVLSVVPSYAMVVGWIGLGTAMFLGNSVVTSCAFGTFSESEWLNNVVGLVCGLPLLVSYSSLRQKAGDTRIAVSKLANSYLWWLSSFVDMNLSNFASNVTPTTIVNNITMIGFAAAGVLLIVKYFGLAMLGKYYLAPLVVFHIWQSLSIKIKYSRGAALPVLEAKINDNETTLIQVARLINKQYKSEDITLRDVSRLLSKTQKKMVGQAWYFPMLHKLGGWEMYTPASEVTRSLHASLVDDAALEPQAKPKAAVAVSAEKEAAESADTDAGLAKRHAQQVAVATKTTPEEEVDVYRFDWTKTTKLAIMHVTGLYGVYLISTGTVDYRTLLLASYMNLMAGLGITGGYHRLWAHKSFNASRPIEYLLAFYGAAAGEGSIFWWSRDHRMHHKFEDTRRDPYSIRYGFFWAHIGWLMHYKSDHLMKEGKRLCDGGLMKDLENNEVVTWQRRHFGKIFLLAAIVQPTLIASLWGDAYNGLFVAGALALMCTFQSTMCVNSLAHMWGEKPYNKKISAVQNVIVAVITFGEGWHNFHHAFPTDFRCSDQWYQWNPTRWFIKGCAVLGLASNLKTRKVRSQ